MPFAIALVLHAAPPVPQKPAKVTVASQPAHTATLKPVATSLPVSVPTGLNSTLNMSLRTPSSAVSTPASLLNAQRPAPRDLPGPYQVITAPTQQDRISTQYRQLSQQNPPALFGDNTDDLLRSANLYQQATRLVLGPNAPKPDPWGMGIVQGTQLINSLDTSGLQKFQVPYSPVRGPAIH